MVAHPAAAVLAQDKSSKSTWALQRDLAMMLAPMWVAWVATKRTLAVQSPWLSSNVGCFNFSVFRIWVIFSCLPAKRIKFNFLIQASYCIENAHILRSLFGSSVFQFTGLSIFWIIRTLLFIIESQLMFSNMIFLRWQIPDSKYITCHYLTQCSLICFVDSVCFFAGEL